MMVSDNKAARAARTRWGKAHALLTILGWSTLWLCAVLAAITDPGNPGLMVGYTLAAFAGFAFGTRSYLLISQEVC